METMNVEREINRTRGLDRNTTPPSRHWSQQCSTSFPHGIVSGLERPDLVNVWTGEFHIMPDVAEIADDVGAILVSGPVAWAAAVLAPSLCSRVIFDSEVLEKNSIELIQALGHQAPSQSTPLNIEV